MSTDSQPKNETVKQETLRLEIEEEEEEEEVTRQNGAEGLPWDPSKIRITTKHFSLREVIEDIDTGAIDLSPDFQRDYVWKKRQRTKLVESILLGVPLPAFYFNQDNLGEYQVVDGVQRLSTVRLFMKDGHVLEKDDLEYLKHLDGYCFSHLDAADARRFKTTQIVVHVIEPQTPDEVKYDIFSRVNTLGMPLSTQEIRHAMSKPKSRKFLKELSDSQIFNKATNRIYMDSDVGSKNGTKKTLRMLTQELALRFCAFRRYSDYEYRLHANLNAYLVDFTRRIDGVPAKAAALTDKDLIELKNEFECGMLNAHEILGDTAFRKVLPNALVRRGPLSRAIFESQAVALADYKLDELKPKQMAIKDMFSSLFTDPEYARAIGAGTGTAKNVYMRIEWPKMLLSEVLK